jgi:hypothetical protein
MKDLHKAFWTLLSAVTFGACAKTNDPNNSSGKPEEYRIEKSFSEVYFNLQGASNINNIVFNSTGGTRQYISDPLSKKKLEISSLYIEQRDTLSAPNGMTRFSLNNKTDSIVFRTLAQNTNQPDTLEVWYPNSATILMNKNISASDASSYYLRSANGTTYRAF